jgi:murein DD-endopeptidase MepM/ murein hydrolase activator NlpD
MDRLARLRRREWGAAGVLVALAVVLAGCASGGPAPVVNNEQSIAPPTQIIVQRGQTLSGIARSYRIPMLALAEANRLAPPYRILAGQALIIPAGSQPEAAGPRLAMEAPMAAPASRIETAPLAPAPPSSVEPTTPSQSAVVAPAQPPLLVQPPPIPTPPAAAASAANRSESSPPSDSQPSSGERKPASAEPSAAAAKAPRPLAAAEPPPAAAHGAAFLWPVRGHVVEGFGAGPGGTHNDGINIAAPRGAAIEATDGGVVAYTGNELRGYGNLILIKHPGGWISAYAHCDLVLVKTGQKVARGQVIARVGSTGNVSQPQLHFELRQGKKPVDPREYLAPLSTAAARGTQPG